MIVVVQRTARFFALQRFLDGRRIRKVNIQPSVAVIVQQQHAPSHRFEDGMGFRGKVVLEADPRLISDVFELRNGPPFALYGFRRSRRWRALAHSLAQ